MWRNIMTGMGTAAVLMALTSGVWADDPLNAKVDASLKKLEELNREVQKIKDDIARLRKESEDTSVPFVSEKIISRKTAAAKPAPVMKLDNCIEYQVKKGDTLGSISSEYYGKPSFWKTILELNQKVVPAPEKLRSGVTIQLPLDGMRPEKIPK